MAPVKRAARLMSTSRVHLNEDINALHALMAKIRDLSLNHDNVWGKRVSVQRLLRVIKFGFDASVALGWLHGFINLPFAEVPAHALK